MTTSPAPLAAAHDEATAPNRWQRGLLAGAVGMAAALVYLGVLGAGFLYDDRWTIVDNPFIRDLGNLGRLFSSDYFASVPDANRPVMVLSQMLDHALFGAAPWGHHAVSVAWHVLASLLVLVMARRLLLDERAAGAAALVFAVHPVHCEAVAAVNYREDLLVAVGVLAAWWLVLRGREARTPGRRWGYRAAAALVAALAAGAKESALALPLVLLGSDLLRAPRGARRRALRESLVDVLVVGVAVTAVLGLLWWGSQGTLASQETDSAGLGARAWAIPRTVAGYLGQLVAPVGLSAEYTIARPGAADPWSWAALLMLVSGALLIIRNARRWPPLALGALVFVVTLLPVLDLVPIFNPRADRYLYLPSFGFALVAGWGLTRVASWFVDRLSPTARAGRPLLGWVPVLMCCTVAGGITARHTSVWKSELALWTATVRTAPDAPRAWLGLALAHLDQGRTVEAEAAVTEGLRVKPSHASLLMMRGILRAGRGDLEPALDDLEAARPRLPARDLGRLEVNRGAVLERLGRLDDAEAAYRAAIARSPGSWQAHKNLALLLKRAGRLPEAAEAFRRASELSPERAQLRAALQKFAHEEPDR